MSDAGCVEVWLSHQTELLADNNVLYMFQLNEHNELSCRTEEVCFQTWFEQVYCWWLTATVPSFQFLQSYFCDTFSLVLLRCDLSH